MFLQFLKCTSKHLSNGNPFQFLYFKSREWKRRLIFLVSLRISRYFTALPLPDFSQTTNDKMFLKNRLRAIGSNTLLFDQSFPVDKKQAQTLKKVQSWK